MRVLLFTVLNCIACDKHRRELMDFVEKHKVSLNIYNIDDPRYLNMSLKAMRLYGIRKTPSIVLLDEERQPIATIEGIHNSLTRLEKKIHEKRTAD